MDIKKCKHCLVEFVGMGGRVFSNHVRWCKSNPNCNNTKNIANAVQKLYDNKLGVIKEYNVNCLKCNKVFIVLEREKKHPQMEAYYCGKSCSNSRTITNELKERIRQSLKGRNRIDREERKCIECNINFIVLKNSDRKLCSKICRIKNKRNCDEYKNYYFGCKFKFNVYKFPEAFDLELIKQHGWYKAFNRGNNLNGVSRDHKISVRHGWEHKIPAEIISHPANCQLMLHNDNVSKYTKCSILYEELLNDIEQWNVKYLLVKGV